MGKLLGKILGDLSKINVCIVGLYVIKKGVSWGQTRMLLLLSDVRTKWNQKHKCCTPFPATCFD